jgi:hypothetical protein
VNAAVDEPWFERKREVIDEFGGGISGTSTAITKPCATRPTPLVSHYNNLYDPIPALRISS